MPASANLSGPASRKRPRAARRSQLIEATIEAMAEKGFARTTMADVARKAGLAHGLVNFHFQSKDLLLAETLAYLSEEYRANWTDALASAPPTPAARLDALIRANFEPAICTPARLAAWLSFWAEASSRPLYQETCGGNDRFYIKTLESLCAELLAEGGYDGDAIRIARVIRLTIEGIWADLVSSQPDYDRAAALRTVLDAAAAFFPRHFSAEGGLSPAQPQR
jgi:TetR/AcrR family transcriptional repressor of bet genes